MYVLCGTSVKIYYILLVSLYEKCIYYTPSSGVPVPGYLGYLLHYKLEIKRLPTTLRLLRSRIAWLRHS